MKRKAILTFLCVIVILSLCTGCGEKREIKQEILSKACTAGLQNVEVTAAKNSSWGYQYRVTVNSSNIDSYTIMGIYELAQKCCESPSVSWVEFCLDEAFYASSDGTSLRMADGYVSCDEIGIEHNWDGIIKTGEMECERCGKEMSAESIKAKNGVGITNAERAYTSLYLLVDKLLSNKDG